MRHFDTDQIHHLLDYPRLVAALRQAHRDHEMPQLHVDVQSDCGNSDNKFVSLLSWGSGQMIAVKMVGVFPGNTCLSPPQPFVLGLVALLDGRTGAALATCDGAPLTFRKTAADSALGVDLLARQDAEICWLEPQLREGRATRRQPTTTSCGAQDVCSSIPETTPKDRGTWRGHWRSMSSTRRTSSPTFSISCKGRHPGHESDNEITVYKNVGGGHLDMFAIRHLVAQADAVG